MVRHVAPLIGLTLAACAAGSGTNSLHDDGSVSGFGDGATGPGGPNVGLKDSAPGGANADARPGPPPDANMRNPLRDAEPDAAPAPEPDAAPMADPDAAPMADPDAAPMADPDAAPMADPDAARPAPCARGELVRTPFAALTERHEGCDGEARIGSAECGSAVHRFCSRRGCANSGFGPVEHSDGNATVTCVDAHWVGPVSFAVLAGFHEECDGDAHRIGEFCNAAIHRYCGSSGGLSGFGPVESRQDEIDVACLTGAGAQVFRPDYDELANHHDGCDGVAQYEGPACNAAFHRYCQARGFLSGYGPAEHNGSVNATVVCVSD